jgi:hypothetical protein
MPCQCADSRPITLLAEEPILVSDHDNNDSGTTSETITRGRKLNGTTQADFTTALTPTTDPCAGSSKIPSIISARLLDMTTRSCLSCGAWPYLENDSKSIAIINASPESAVDYPASVCVVNGSAYGGAPSRLCRAPPYPLPACHRLRVPNSIALLANLGHLPGAPARLSIRQNRAECASIMRLAAASGVECRAIQRHRIALGGADTGRKLFEVGVGLVQQLGHHRLLVIGSYLWCACQRF